jgi:hypothetical protein
VTAVTNPVAGTERVVPAAVTGIAVITLAVAGYGIAGPARPPVESGLLNQVAAGERISASSQLAAAVAPPATPAARTTKAPRPTNQRWVCSRIDGSQVTAVGDSVMLASAQALEDDMPGIDIDAKVGMQMQTGVQIVQSLAASGALRHFVVVGLGTNGDITPGQIWQLREAAGHDRELVMVNTYGPMSWESEVNAVLAKATWHKPHVALVDWSDAIAAHSYLLWDDGIHPQPSGGRLYAHVVEDTLRSTC